MHIPISMAMGFWGIAAAASVSFGPLIGGYLVDNHRRDAVTQHRHDATSQRLDRLEAEVQALKDKEVRKP